MARARRSRVKIRIKKKNQGSFTRTCKRWGYSGVTSKCIQRALKNKSPTLRKRANFARNARKWKKGGKKRK